MGWRTWFQLAQMVRCMSLMDIETWIKKMDGELGVLFMVMHSYNEFLPPLSLGAPYILYRLSFIIWALHLLIIQTPVPSDALTSSLWVAVTKVALFRGLLPINAARRVAVVHLMWWWQPLMEYLNPLSFYVLGVRATVTGMHHWSGLWNVRGGITPRTCFLCPSLLGQGFWAATSPRKGWSSDGPKAQPACYSGSVPTIAPQNSGSDLPPRRKAGFWHL